jgi:hypothetical protein
MAPNTPEIALNPAAQAGTRPRFSFFFFAHLALLAVVLVGFSPTFFLRAFFDVPLMEPVLYAHGAVLTLWFLFTVVQAWLVRARRLRLHRTIGYIAAGYAALVVVLGLVANSHLPLQIESPANPFNIIYWANLFSLVQFAAFVALVVVYRKSPDAHKRLTLLASVAIVGPALARFPLWPMFAGGVDTARNYAIGGLLVLLGAMIVHDLIVRRRPHPVTWIGSLAVLVSLATAVFLGVSGKGFAILHG